MPRSSQDLTMKLILSVIALLLGAHLLVRIDNGPQSAQAAPAGGLLPDTGAQFQQMIDELKDVNKRLDTLEKFLESGNLTVKTKADDKDSK